MISNYRALEYYIAITKLPEGEGFLPVLCLVYSKWLRNIFE